MNIQHGRKAYAMKFASYLIDTLSEKNMLSEIENIILFGSIAREESTEKSDVDIFIDIKKKTQKIISIIDNIVAEFYNSRESLIYKSKGIDNKLNVIIGKLSEWEEINRSIMSTGIFLWGPYKTMKKPEGVKHYAIFFWDKIEKNRGAFLNAVYGFTINKKHHIGLIHKFNGKRLGKSCIMMPIQYRNEVDRLLKKYRVHSKIIEIFIE